MVDYSLDAGAHLLLWVFPVALILLVVINSVRDLRRHGDEP